MQTSNRMMSSLMLDVLYVRVLDVEYLNNKNGLDDREIVESREIQDSLPSFK